MYFHSQIPIQLPWDNTMKLYANLYIWKKFKKVPKEMHSFIIVLRMPSGLLRENMAFFVKVPPSQNGVRQRGEPQLHVHRQSGTSGRFVVDEAGEVLGQDAGPRDGPRHWETCAHRTSRQVSDVRFLSPQTDPSSVSCTELQVNHILSVPQFPPPQTQIIFLPASKQIFVRRYLCSMEMFERSPEIVSANVVHLKCL